MTFTATKIDAAMITKSRAFTATAQVPRTSRRACVPKLQRNGTADPEPRWRSSALATKSGIHVMAAVAGGAIVYLVVLTSIGGLPGVRVLFARSREAE